MRILEKIKKKVNERKKIIFNDEIIEQYPNGFISLGDYEKITDKIFFGKQYYSQCYQDFFLEKFLYKNKNTGFFLDVGGNHPTYINNTYFFEQKGWTGLAIEPMPEMNKLWKEVRTATCLQLAVGNKEQILEFKEYEDNYMSGISNKVDYEGKINKVYNVKCTTLENILTERRIKEVDFMSLDVEGCELEALQGINFKKVNIKCIVMENNKGNERDLRQFMIKNGYKMFAKIWFDEIWIKE